MKSICVFNNKGGVGKTTLTTNVASVLAKHYGLKVLVVDCDPQCNSTQLIMGEEECVRAYYEPAQASDFPTILDLVKPLLDGDATVEAGVAPSPAAKNRFGVHLLAGHPRFSMLEDVLSEAWSNVRGGNLGGLRKTNWFFSLCELHRNSYDLMLVDVGPSLGSINRSILLGADGFIAPMGSDVFSIIGIRNVADWLGKWSVAYDRGMQALRDERPTFSADYPMRARSGISGGFFGYTVQQYIAKTVGGERRPTKAYENILRRVPEEISNSLVPYAAPSIEPHCLKLGDVPNMFSLVPMAQSAGAPIHALTSADGIRGAQYAQQTAYAEQFRFLAENLIRNAGIRADGAP